MTRTVPLQPVTSATSTSMYVQTTNVIASIVAWFVLVITDFRNELSNNPEGAMVLGAAVVCAKLILWNIMSSSVKVAVLTLETSAVIVAFPVVIAFCILLGVLALVLLALWPRIKQALRKLLNKLKHATVPYVTAVAASVAFALGGPVAAVAVLNTGFFSWWAGLDAEHKRAYAYTPLCLMIANFAAMQYFWTRIEANFNASPCVFAGLATAATIFVVAMLVCSQNKSTGGINYFTKTV